MQNNAVDRGGDVRCRSSIYADGFRRSAADQPLAGPMIAKRKVVRLTGRKLAELNKAIHDRDEDRCVICGRWVDPGEKFHHEPCGPFKQDQIECGVVLCQECHNERHFGSNPNDYRDKIERYLGGKYAN